MQVQRTLLACPTRKTATNARETLSSVLSLAVKTGVARVNVASYRYECPEAFGVWLTSFEQIGVVIDWVHSTVPGTPEERMCAGVVFRFA